ncbi:MAG: hypothetical protein AB7S26_05595 [Sandaracinaceae bacterium]
MWRHPFLLALAGSVVGYLSAVSIAPELVRWAFHKEGAVEHASHLVLLVAIGLFAQAALVVRGAARPLAAFMVVYLAWLLLEETDYGLVYHLDLGGMALREMLGVPNLHNAGHATSLVGSAMFWIAAPLGVYSVLGLVPRLRLALAPVSPTRRESVGLVLACIATVVFDSLRPLAWRLGEESLRSEPESSAMGFFQTVLYGMLAAVAWRSARQDAHVGEG